MVSQRDCWNLGRRHQSKVQRTSSTFFLPNWSKQWCLELVPGFKQFSQTHFTQRFKALKAFIYIQYLHLTEWLCSGGFLPFHKHLCKALGRENTPSWLSMCWTGTAEAEISSTKIPRGQEWLIKFRHSEDRQSWGGGELLNGWQTKQEVRIRQPKQSVLFLV